MNVPFSLLLAAVGDIHRGLWPMNALKVPSL
jgi:hypothetical protein